LKYLKIRHWDTWQTYRKDRGQPPWIKLHRCVMRDPEWVLLSDAQRGQLVAMWLLAADRDGAIPASPLVLQKLCFMSSEPELNLLMELGFIIDDDNAAPCGSQPDANMTHQSREEAEKSRVDKTLTSSQQVVTDPKQHVPYNKIVALYHQTLPDHPKVRVLTPARKSSIKQRHIQDMERSLEEWESYFCLVGRSEFLTGKAPPSNGRRVFMADLEWICKQGNFAKIYEGKYHGQI
jgi:hypothetical protein